MPDSRSIITGGFVLATILWLVRSRRAVSQLWTTRSQQQSDDFPNPQGPYRIAAVAIAASWVLVPVSLWAQHAQVWGAVAGLLLSLSMLVQFRAEGRKRLARIGLWMTIISGVTLIVTLLAETLQQIS